MARIRTIKPEFFLDEELAALSAYHRLVFIGLWTQADKAGKLEDRPQRLKALLLPYENKDMESILTDLARENFITRYENSGGRYIKIKNFLKHQRPHHTELESEIPDFNGEITVNTPLDNGEKPDGREGKGKEGKGRERKGDYVDFEKSTLTIWNSFCDKNPILSKVKEISGRRRTALKNRFTQTSFRDWGAILAAVQDQPFCMGKNDRGWKVSFDWLISNDTNYLKVLEFKYSDKKGNPEYQAVDPNCVVCSGKGVVYNQSTSSTSVCSCRIKKIT